MIDLIKRPFQRPEYRDSKDHNAFLLSIIILLAAVAMEALYLYLILQVGITQLIGPAIITCIIAIASVFSSFLCLRGRAALGVKLIIISIAFAGIAAQFFMADLGFVVGITCIFVITMLAGQALESKIATRFVLLGYITGLATYLLDVYGDELVAFGSLSRFSDPTIQKFIPIVAGLVAVAYSGFIVKQFSNYTLRTKLIVVFLSVTLVTFGIFAYFNNQRSERNLVETANKTLFTFASETASRLETFIAGSLDTVRTEALLPNFVTLLSNSDQTTDIVQTRALLFSLNGRDVRNIVSYGLLDRNGVNVLDTVGGKIGSSEADFDFFKIPLETGEPYVSPVLFIGDVEELNPTTPALGTTPEDALFADFTRDPEIVFSAPVHNLEGIIVGVLRVRYKASILQDLLVQSTALQGDESLFAVLFDENTLHLAHSNVEVAKSVNYKLTAFPLALIELRTLQETYRIPDLPTQDLSTSLPVLRENLLNAQDAPYFVARDVDPDESNRVAVKVMDKLPWRVAFFQPEDEFFRPVREQTNFILALTVVMAGIAAIAAAGTAQILTAPITRLTQVAQKVSSGNLDEQAPVETGDEIGVLARAFNEMTAQLRGFIGTLEEQVRGRTEDLSLSMEVGQRASVIRDLDVLLPTITEYVRQTFDLYYTQIYFVDELRHNLVLRSGTGELGERLIARRHSLPIDSNSMVGLTVLREAAVVVPDTEESAIHKLNPALPETRSELSVPLISEGQVVAVLDMQAVDAGTFTEENRTVFEAMATQISIAIDSAKQWTIAQEAQHRAEEAVKQLTRESWAEALIPTNRKLNYVYDLSVVSEGGFESLEQNRLNTPLVIQNEQVGQFAVESPNGREWDVDERALLNSVAQQLAQKVENLRLFEQTQQRASREQLTRQITEKIRASRDIEAALQTAAQELSKALRTPRAVVNLKVPKSQDRKGRS